MIKIHNETDKQIDNGFLSIEKVADQLYLIHRNFAGILHFKGIILKNSSQVKTLENSKDCAKIKVFEHDAEQNKLVKKCVTVQFLLNEDTDKFVKIA